MNYLVSLLFCLTLLPAQTAKERHLRQQYDDLAARASAMIDLVDNKQADLRQQGLTLHPDIVTARNSLESSMGRATEALNREDWKDLRRNLDRARGWIDRLQRQL